MKKKIREKAVVNTKYVEKLGINKYAKRELELYNIDESSVVSFTIKNKSAQWEMGIRRER